MNRLELEAADLSFIDQQILKLRPEMPDEELQYLATGIDLQRYPGVKPAEVTALIDVAQQKKRVPKCSLTIHDADRQMFWVVYLLDETIGEEDAALMKRFQGVFKSWLLSNLAALATKKARLN